MTQKEFDSEMSRINGEWMAERKPIEDQIDSLHDAKSKLLNEIRSKYLEIDEICTQLRKLNQQKKDVNMKYHEMKHLLCVTNPKGSTEDEGSPVQH